MANRNVNWVQGAHVRFGNLDFVVTMEGKLVQPPTAAQPPLFTGLDTIAEAPKEQ